MKILYVILGAAISAILYRCGGMSQDPATKPTWIPTRARKRLVRRWGCPLISLAVLFLMGIQPAWWIIAGTFILAWLATTTYWDEV